MNDIISKTVNIPARDAQDRTSIRYNGTDYSGVCRGAKSLMIEFLRECFENLADFDQFKFDEDQKCSKINILDKLTFNLDEVDKKPAIVVHRGGVQYGKIGRDQRLKETRLQNREIDELEGSTIKTGLLRGSLVIQCYGKGQTLQAELLGESVFELITDMEDALRQIGFFECYATGIGEEIPVKQGSKITYIMVPVSVQFSMQRTWSITPTNLRKIRNIVLDRLNANGTAMI